jgi:hypothetical protein
VLAYNNITTVLDSHYNASLPTKAGPAFFNITMPSTKIPDLKSDSVMIYCTEGLFMISSYSHIPSPYEGCTFLKTLLSCTIFKFSYLGVVVSYACDRISAMGVAAVLFVAP